MDDLIYWIWYQCRLGVNNKHSREGLSTFRGVQGIYRASQRELRLAGYFTETEIAHLSDKSLTLPQRILERCHALGLTVLCPEAPDYPEKLSSLASPPIVLYVKGTMPGSSAFQVGMVGTRYPAEVYAGLSYHIAYDLAQRQTVIVSGGAMGIDIAAHRGAVEAGGSTLCVIGCGIDCYQSSYQDLIMNGIPEKGAVISEYPPGIPAKKYHFPARNRLITGLSDCTLVVQAGLGSGALIAAKYAIAQNKKLFAIPGPADQERFSGSNLLIRNGFSAVLTYRDILRWHQEQQRRPTPPEKHNPPLDRSMSAELSLKAEELTIPPHPGQRSFSLHKGYLLNEAMDTRCRILQEPIENIPDQEFQIPVPTTEATPAPIEQRQLLEEVQRLREENPEDSRSFAARLIEVLCRRYQLNIPKQDSNHELMTDSYREMQILRSLYEQLGWNPQQHKQTTPVDTDRGQPHSEKLPDTESERREPGVDLDKTDRKSDNAEELSYKKHKNYIPENKISIEQLTENALTVYHTISDEPVFSDSIMLKTGLPVGKILAALTELQMLGLAEALPGSRYVRTEVCLTTDNNDSEEN